MNMATEVVVTQMEFVDRIFATAKKSGVETKINRNGDRQIDFDNKSLTDDHLRRLFQDIVRRKSIYSRADMDLLLGASRPCAVAPFFDLAVKAGFATQAREDGEQVYRFKFVRRTDE